MLVILGSWRNVWTGHDIRTSQGSAAVDKPSEGKVF